MPFDDRSQHSTASFISYVCTDEGAAAARAVLAASGGTAGAVHGGGLSGAARLPAETFDSRIVLAEIGQIPLSMACECVAELSRLGVGVIVVGAADDLSTYRALCKAGALDYFPFPVDAHDILNVTIKPTVASEVTPAASAKGLSIGVVGCKGGVGASLLAQNLAAFAGAPKGAKQRVALFDADLEFGTQAIDLDRDETRGIFDALCAPDRVDETFLNSTMEQIDDRLAVYSAQVRIGQLASSFEPGIARLLPRLRDEFDAVVTDVPRGTLLRQPDIAQQFDVLALVLPAGFAGVNAAGRLIDHLCAEAPDMRILPVLSQVRKDAGLSVRDIERTLNRSLTATLPKCDAILAKAHRAAKPLVTYQRRSPWAKAVKQVWAAAQPDLPAPRRPRTGWFK